MNGARRPTSTASASSTSPSTSPGRRARGSSPTWAPRSSRSSTRRTVTRTWPTEPRVTTAVGLHRAAQPGKRSLCLDATTPAGSRRACSTWCPTSTRRRELRAGRHGPPRRSAYDDLAAVNDAADHGVGVGLRPDRSACGTKTAYDFIVQGFSGHDGHQRRTRRRPAAMSGMALVDAITGVHAFAAVGHALFRRERTGRGTLHRLLDARLPCSPCTSGPCGPLDRPVATGPAHRPRRRGRRARRPLHGPAGLPRHHVPREPDPRPVGRDGPARARRRPALLQQPRTG